jgi:hypothetical protein
MKLISRISPPHLGHVSGNSSPTRASSFAQAIRDVSWWQGFASMVPVEPQQPLPAASETPACSKVAAIRAAVSHEFPSSDITTMLAEIDRGVVAGQPAVPPVTRRQRRSP